MDSDNINHSLLFFSKRFLGISTQGVYKVPVTHAVNQFHYNIHDVSLFASEWNI